MGGGSSIDNRHYVNIVETITEIDPGTNVLPVMAPWGTDLKYFRTKGIPAYGFTPIRDDRNGLTVDDSKKLVHGIDEKISVDNLMLNLEFFYKLLKKY